MAESAAGREFYPELRRELASQLPSYLAGQRWFGGKARTISAAELLDVVPVPLANTIAGSDPRQALLLIVSIAYAEGPGESYAIPVLRAADVTVDRGGSAHLKISGAGGSFEFVDALKEEAFLSALLQLIDAQATAHGEKGELRGSQTSAYACARGVGAASLPAKPVGAEQSNTSIIYGDRLILKFVRRVEEGVNPDLELSLIHI